MNGYRDDREARILRKAALEGERNRIREELSRHSELRRKERQLSREIARLEDNLREIGGLDRNQRRNERRLIWRLAAVVFGAALIPIAMMGWRTRRPPKSDAQLKRAMIAATAPIRELPGGQLQPSEDADTEGRCWQWEVTGPPRRGDFGRSAPPVPGQIDETTRFVRSLRLEDMVHGLRLDETPIELSIRVNFDVRRGLPTGVCIVQTHGTVGAAARALQQRVRMRVWQTRIVPFLLGANRVQFAARFSDDPNVPVVDQRSLLSFARTRIP